jgi:hypothetical protein
MSQRDRLVQEWEERRNDLVDHVTMQIGQDLSGLHALPGSIVELYLHGEIELHIHWSSGINRPDDIPRDFCARCLNTADRHRLNEEVVAAKADAVLDWGAYGIEKSMPINAGKIVERPKPMRREIRPQEVWLQTLDECLRSRIDKTDVLNEGAVALALGWGFPSDWERDVLRLVIRERAAVRDGQLKSEMVERRPEILERVANEGGEVWWLRGPAITDHRLPGFRVVFTDEGLSVAFKPLGDLPVERTRMFFCPIKLPLVAPHSATLDA